MQNHHLHQTNANVRYEHYHFVSIDFILENADLGVRCERSLRSKRFDNLPLLLVVFTILLTDHFFCLVQELIKFNRWPSKWGPTVWPVCVWSRLKSVQVYLRSYLWLWCFKYSVADPRGAPLQPKMFSISCSFLKNLAKPYVAAPPEDRCPLLQVILDPPLVLTYALDKVLITEERYGNLLVYYPIRKGGGVF